LIRIFCVILTLLPASAFCARVYDVGSVALRAGILGFDVKEFDRQGKRLVHESDPLYGVDIALGLRRRQFGVKLDAAYYAGDVDYEGQTQAGTPINSSTDERFVDVSVTGVYQLASVPAVSVYAGPGYRYWRREIQSVGASAGLDETYRWWKLQAGMNIGWMRAKNHWVFDGSVIRVLSPGVDVDLGNRFDTAGLNLGDRWGWRVGGRWIRMLSPRLAVTFDFFYERQRLGKSGTQTLRRNGSPVGSIFQPRIEMTNSGILVGLTQSW